VTVLAESLEARLAEARALVASGRYGQGIASLRGLLAESPGLAQAQLLLGQALEAQSDRAGAEDAFGRALALDPSLSDAAVRLARLLLARRRADAAVAILEPLAMGPDPDLDLLTTFGLALKAAGRLEASAKAYRLATGVAPESGVAEHNLAGALAEVHSFAESEAAAARAFAKGLDAPETWLVRGRALQGLGEIDAAEAAFSEAIKRRPAYAEAHADLAQLVWMKTEDVGLATRVLDAALKAHPWDAPLSLAKSRLLEYVGDIDGAYEVVAEAIRRGNQDPTLRISAAALIAAKEPDSALFHAQKAFAMAPGLGPAKTALCLANLAAGRADVAATIAEELCQEWPLDQYPICLAATAWRILGDPRYPSLYDYERLVRADTIETPPGWPTLQAYLADLAARLRDLQRLKGHPIGQSLRQGAQTGQSLAMSDDPVIKAMFTALHPHIAGYIALLGLTDDVLGRRATESYRFSGAWSVSLRPGGRHVDHLHPMGWISSAMHIVVPAAVDRGREGWLTFGEPGLPTIPKLDAEYFVKPQAGRLVLFPSYMWHGTVPFGGEEPRLSVAFDVLPG
jgi:tetratricopeptide (TPR) repeat protein